MSTVMRIPLQKLTEGEMLSSAEIHDCFNAIMEGEVSQIQISAFLIALKMRGERVEDIAAAATVMREKATIIKAPDDAMDIVGTGGDGIGTYNISTASAFVVALPCLAAEAASERKSANTGAASTNVSLKSQAPSKILARKSGVDKQ